MTRHPATAATLLVLTALTAACTDDVDTPGRVSGEPSAAEAGAACPAETDAALAAWAEAGFAGTIAVTAGGEPECLAAHGTADKAAGRPHTPDTVFAIGSVSKAVTAAAVLGLVDDGALALDDRVGDLVPGLAGPVADATVEQLLLHTSGLSGSHGADHQPLDRDDAVAAIGRLPLAFAPGTDHLYSNAGYTLLAAVVEEATGTPYREHVAAEVLRLPDGTAVGGFWDGEPAAPGPRAVGRLEDGSTGEPGDFAGPHWALAGNGDVAMTMPDLAAWTHALFTGGILSAGMTDLVAAPGFDHGDGTGEAPGWVVVDAARFGEPLVTASGGGGDVGHEVVVAWLPESERVVAVASNTPEVTAGDLVEALAPALDAGDPLPRPEAPAPDVEVAAAELAALAGTYVLPGGGELDVTVDDDGLAVAAAGTDAVEALFPLPAGVGRDEAGDHEAQVAAVLAGETDAGSEERAAIEDEFGPIGEVEVIGTIVGGGELRTYVTVTAGGERLTGWYALDDRGGIAAVDLGAGPPTRRLVATGDRVFRPAGGGARGPDVTVGFGDGRLTITGPAGPVEAQLAG